MRRTRQVGRIARGLVEVVCGYPCVRLPMPMSQNMRNRCSGWPLLQSRRGRDRKRSPAWGAAHRCRVPRHRQSALILAPARSACRSKTAPPPARRFPTGAAMTSVARANGRHPVPRPRCVLIVRFLRIDAALLIASLPRTSHGSAALQGQILTRSHSLRSLALRLPGLPLHVCLSAMRLIGARSITPRRKERTMKKRTQQVLATVLENLPPIITALATLVTAIAALVEKLN